MNNELAYRLPKISIIIPVYNVEKYLCRCLDSISAQNLTDWECILVDDGSLDGSGLICDEYVKKDSRFRVIHQKNSGVSVARNVGIKSALGEWIGFVDSDDWIEKETYQIVLKTAEQNNADLVQWGGFITVGNKDVRKELYVTDFSLDQMDSDSPYGRIFYMLIRKEFLSINNITFPVDLSMGEDWIFAFNCYFKSHKIINIKNVAFYHYFLNPNSTCHQMTKKNLYSQIDFINKFEKLINSSPYKSSLMFFVDKQKMNSKFNLADKLQFKLYRKTFPEIESMLIRTKHVYRPIYILLYMHLDFLAFLGVEIIHILKNVKHFILGKNL